MNIPELKKAMEKLKEIRNDYIKKGRYAHDLDYRYEDKIEAIDKILSVCQLLCDVSDKMEPKKETDGKWRIEFQYLLDRKILSRDELAYLFGQIKSIVEQEANLARSEDILWLTKRMMGIHTTMLIFIDKYKSEHNGEYPSTDKIADAIRQEILGGGE